MKDLKDIIKESKTSNKNIEEYAKSWTIENNPEDFEQMLYFFVKGLKAGLNENKKAYKDNETLLDYINDSLNLVSKIEYQLSK